MTGQPEPAIADPEKQLEWEKHHRTRAAIAALLAGAGLLAFNVAQQVVQRDIPSASGLEALQRGVAPGDVNAMPSLQTAAFEHIHTQTMGTIVTAVGGFVGYLALAWAVGFLAVATRSRMPTVRRFIVYVPIVGGVLLGVSVLMTQFGSLAAINEFLGSRRSVADADEATRAGVVLYGGLLFTLGSLALAAGIIVVSLNAMRAGLLSRMLGYLGIASGAMMVLYSLPIVQVFWLGALGFVLLGRWPGGELPAWASGQAVPWPTAERPPPRQRRGAPAPAPARDPAASTPAPARRKRKKRS